MNFDDANLMRQTDESRQLIDRFLELGQQGTVGVKQDVSAALFQIADHARQRLDHHRLSDAVQYNSSDARNLVDDAGEELPTHVGRRLEILKGARASLTQQIAAIGGLEVEADRLLLRARPALVADGFEVAAWIGVSASAGCHVDLRALWHRRTSGRCRRARLGQDRHRYTSRRGRIWPFSDLTIKGARFPGSRRAMSSGETLDGTHETASKLLLIGAPL